MATKVKTGNGTKNEAQRLRRSSRSQKILVIGCTGFAGVRCVEWTRITEIENIADFDVVFVSSGSLTSAVDNLSNTAGKESADLVEAAHDLENLQIRLRERLIRVLRSGGSVFAIVHPYRGANLCNGHFSRRSCTSNTSWLPLPVATEREPGDTLNLQNEQFARYFSMVKNWPQVFGQRYNRADLGFLTEGELDPKPRARLTAQDIALDRQGQMVSATQRFVLHKDTGPGYEGGRSYESDGYFTSGPLILLPPPTQAIEEEGIRVLLEDFCGLEARTPSPAFAQAMRLPGEDALDAEIEKQERELNEAKTKVDQLIHQKQERRRFIALIYEKGIAGLQDVAQEAFEELGLTTKDADPDVSDEFYVCDGEDQALVEVRGHRKSSQISDIRQLIDNLLKYEQKHGGRIKGIQLVNAWNELPPEERDNRDKSSFPDNVIRRAKDMDIALLSGVELLNALCSYWRGEIDSQAVFARLLSGRGLVTFSPTSPA